MTGKLIPPRRQEFWTPQGLPTQRFIKFIEGITGVSNDNSAAVDAQITQNLSSALFTLQEQVGSGDFLTTDTDSFTTDDDRFSTDMDEA